jgi:hypothetical protein
MYGDNQPAPAADVDMVRKNFKKQTARYFFDWKIYRRFSNPIFLISSLIP